MPELKNKRHECFCLELVSGKSGTQAAIEAGYSARSAGNMANRLMKNDDIKRRIDDLLAELSSEKVADAQEVMEYLSSVLRGESRSSVLCLAGEGTQCVIEKPPDERERLKAAELLGKRYGLYTDRIQRDVDMDLNITVNYGDEEGAEDAN